MTIFINQIGYRPQDQKVAFSSHPGDQFDILDSEDDVVYSGHPIIRAANDPASGDTVYEMDFTQVEKPGTYRISINNELSPEFEIKSGVYHNLSDALLKSMYFQRCGVELEQRYASDWKHDPCHTQLASIYPSGEKIDVSGGWHDAGDYGRYIEPAAKAVADLLRAYELFPAAFSKQIGIPESGNGIPDILNETRVELEWFLKMQDKGTGGVYSKVTTANFPSMIMPEADHGELYVYPFSTTATADFVAVMAMATRVYKNHDISFSQTCLAAAKLGWQWLISHTNEEYHSFAGKSLETGTGGYGDRHDTDERYWAAAEMLRTTKEAQYNNYFVEMYKKDINHYEYTWASVAGYGSFTYLMTAPQYVDPIVFQEISAGFIDQADRWANISERDGYGISLLPEDYVWGSNGVVMDQAMHLITAYLLKRNAKYTGAALAHLNYLLGSNPLGICYVTGFGSQPVLSPHHRPSAADKIEQPVPGMVAGGPNKELQDNVAREAFQNQNPPVPPAKRFIDHVGSYATNEMTVYWNSPAVLVAAFFA